MMESLTDIAARTGRGTDSQLDPLEAAWLDFVEELIGTPVANPFAEPVEDDPRDVEAIDFMRRLTGT